MTSIAENLEEKIQEDPIRCIFFSEFHHIAGPKITCQVRKKNVSQNIDKINTFAYIYLYM